VKVTS